MKNIKKIMMICTSVLIVYSVIIVIFEVLLAYYQPQNEHATLVITTVKHGHQKSRVLSKIDYQGNLYVSANHWPRAWYKQSLANPNIKVTYKGKTEDYTAISVSQLEHDRLSKDKKHL